MIIQFPDRKTMLIDGGGESSANLLRYLRALKIRTIDFLMLTHPDPEHCGGLTDVLALYSVENIYMPDCRNPDRFNAYAKFVNAANRAAERGNTTLHISQTYTAFTANALKNFYYAMILSPLPASSPKSYYRFLNKDYPSEAELNDCSAVVYLEYAGVRFLFTGDISERVEEDLYRNYLALGADLFAVSREVEGQKITLAPDLCNVDVLKVSDHGSSRATSADFTALLCPSVALIGVGAGNRYNNPSVQTLRRLLSANSSCAVYRTDEVGNVSIIVNASGKMRVRTQSALTANAVRSCVIPYRKKFFRSIP